MAGVKRRRPAVQVSRRTDTVLRRLGLTLEDAGRTPDSELRRLLGIGPTILREIRGAVGGPTEQPEHEAPTADVERHAAEFGAILADLMRVGQALADVERRLRKLIARRLP